MKLKDIVRESRETFKGDMSGVPVVGLEHLIPEEISFSEYEISSDKTFTKAFHKGQVLFGRRRAYQKKAAIAHVDGVCSGDIMVLEAIPGKMEPSLLPFIIQNDRFFDYAIQHSEGGLSPRVKWNAIANYEFSLPSIEEQKILADKLWAAYRVKESYRQLLATTDDMLKAKFNDMFGKTDFPKSKISDLLADNFSGEWGEDDVDGTGTSVIKTNNFNNDGSIDFTQLVTRNIEAKRVERKRLKAGDILLERSGGTKDNPVGRVVYFDREGIYVTNNFVQTLRVSDKVDSKFLFYSLFIFYNTQKMEIRRLGHQTSGIQNLDFHKFVAREVIVPSMEVQQEFAAIATQAEATKASLRQSIDAIDRVIRSLINQ